MLKLLSIGDCNTLGIGSSEYNSYPERVARQLKADCVNKGHTMCTTREGVHYFNDFYTDHIDLLTIQYGLVDSWKTISNAPYVLYYPDSFFRKLGRKLSKKYKKIAKKLGLKRWLGEASLVSIEEYKNNLIHMLDRAKSSRVILIETVPNLDTSRNENIQLFNSALHEVASRYKNVAVLPLFDLFYNQVELLLEKDGTHINNKGYDLITDEFVVLYNSKFVD